MRRTVCIVTSTRAEWGLLRPLAQLLDQENDISLKLVATGMHLTNQFGLTFCEIEADGFAIDEKIEIQLDSDTPTAVCKTTALAIERFSQYFSCMPIDLLIVLGDRYEMMGVCIVATHLRIPIAHVHGGETTQGAVDESIRHCITKMSYLHFTSCEPYRNRVIQLGEHPDRVYNTGALGVENALTLKPVPLSDIENFIGMDIGTQPFAIVTFHPVTLDEEDATTQCLELLKALNNFPDLLCIFTKANADAGGAVINQIIEHYVRERTGAVLVDSLGSRNYLSALRYAEMVIGNSSSGIIEAPSFHLPTINIGDRQKGRIQASSVINCAPRYEEINLAIYKANDKNFRASLTQVKNPYERKGTAQRIISVIKHYLFSDKIELKKEFYDLPH